MQDWLEEAQLGVGRALEARGGPHYVPQSSPAREGHDGTGEAVLERVVPAACWNNYLLGAEIANTMDALIIAAAQAEAMTTHRRESFMLHDGATGSVDAEGNLWDERPPQG